MSNEELVQLYQNGDRKALDKLIQQNNGFVNKIVNRFYCNHTNSIDREDLVQEGYIGLINAANKYDVNRDNAAKFITYAYFHINRMINGFVNQTDTTTETSLNTPSGEDIELMDQIGSDDYSFENVEEDLYRKQLRNELETAMKDNNTLFERNVLKLRYGWDNNNQASYKEIADMFNTYSGKIRSTEARALTKLRHCGWGERTARDLLHDKVYAIVNGSYFDQDKCANTLDIVDNYFNGVI